MSKSYTTTASGYVSASTEGFFRRVARPMPASPLMPRRIKRDFPQDWYGEVLTAYHSVRDDRPPKRLNRQRRAIMFALLRALRLAEQGVKADS